MQSKVRERIGLNIWVDRPEEANKPRHGLKRLFKPVTWTSVYIQFTEQQSLCFNCYINKLSHYFKLFVDGGIVLKPIMRENDPNRFAVIRLTVLDRRLTEAMLDELASKVSDELKACANEH